MTNFFQIAKQEIVLNTTFSTYALTPLHSSIIDICKYIQAILANRYISKLKKWKTRFMVYVLKIRTCGPRLLRLPFILFISQLWDLEYINFIISMFTVVLLAHNSTMTNFQICCTYWIFFLKAAHDFTTWVLHIHRFWIVSRFSLS